MRKPSDTHRLASYLPIDVPESRPDFKPDPDPLGSQAPDLEVQPVVDLHRGLGDAADKRLAVLGFMANPQSARHFVLSSNSPQMVAFRMPLPANKLKQSLDRYRWADPATYAIHLGPAPSLFQYGTHNEHVRLAAGKRYFKLSSRQKEAKFYNSDHVLNAEARLRVLARASWAFPTGARKVGEIPLTK